jgi:hypothetical protein
MSGGMTCWAYLLPIEKPFHELPPLFAERAQEKKRHPTLDQLLLQLRDQLS